MPDQPEEFKGEKSIWIAGVVRGNCIIRGTENHPDAVTQRFFNPDYLEWLSEQYQLAHPNPIPDANFS